MSSTSEGPDSTTFADLALFYSTQVDADQIDQLGHMNVRFYGIHALAGTRELIARLGMFTQADATAGSQVRFTDLYTRHYLEQLEGSPLEVWGGVLSDDESAVQMYFELRNPEREVLGATFVFKVELQDMETNTHIFLSSEVRRAAEEARIEWPKHGKPRSVDLDSAPQVLSMADVQGKKLEAREIRVIEEKNCDSSGLYNINSFQDLVWGSEGISEDNDWLSTLKNGDRMGWATMESRCTLYQLPRAGTRIQSFRATVEVNQKAQHERFWVFNIDDGTLLCSASFVDVAFNINTRRAIEVPDAQRKKLKEFLCPELA